MIKVYSYIYLEEQKLGKVY